MFLEIKQGSTLFVCVFSKVCKYVKSWCLYYKEQSFPTLKSLSPSVHNQPYLQTVYQITTHHYFLLRVDSSGCLLMLLDPAAFFSITSLYSVNLLILHGSFSMSQIILSLFITIQTSLSSLQELHGNLCKILMNLFHSA